MLYIVATPIGNLKDITFRAIEVFKSVDVVLCEDTRRTAKLFSFYEIKTPLLSYHSYSDSNKTDKILSLLKEGKDLALVSDAGTPGISDPGSSLIDLVVKEGINIIPIPGCSALVAGASISGLPVDKFVFLGFPPARNKRDKFFEELVSYNHTVIIYESPHRIIKTLKDISKFNNSARVVVCRELTKKFETIYRGSIDDVLPQIELKGEFTVIINNR